MVGTFQPLVENQAIVDENGKPTQYFIRFIQQRQEYIGQAADSSIEILAGTGLDGGGPLTGDILLDLSDTAVSPGSYLSANITVDAQGRITAASNGNVPVKISFSAPFTPAASEIFLVYPCAESFTLPANFAGSVGTVMTNPTATYTMTVKKNGSTVGTIAISTGGVFTFATSGGVAVSFVSGDRLTIEGPVTADATLKNFGVTLKG